MSGAAGYSLSTMIKIFRSAAGIGLGTTIKYLRRATSGAADNGLGTTAKYLRGAAGIGLGTTIKYLRRTASAAAGNGLGITVKYLLNPTLARATTGPRSTICRLGTNSSESRCSIAAFVVNPEPRTRARPSVLGCVGPELVRGVHLHSGKVSRRRYIAARVRVVGGSFAAALTRASAVVTPPAPAAQPSGCAFGGPAGDRRVAGEGQLGACSAIRVMNTRARCAARPGLALPGCLMR